MDSLIVEACVHLAVTIKESAVHYLNEGLGLFAAGQLDLLKL